jgi:transposase
MAIVGGLDLHRGQLTFDYLDQDTGEVTTGRVVPADREHLRAWLERFAGEQQVAFALEGCTGWRYVVEELQRAGIAAHLAEPAETAGLRGPKRRAKTDRADARHLRELLVGGRVPASWIAPTHVLEARATVRPYKDLLDERTAWLQRVHATLFHQGVPVIAKLTTPEGAERLAAADLSAAGRQAVAVGLRQIQRLSGEMAPLRQQLADLSAWQVGCRALREAHYGVGPLTSVAIWAELGDCRRFGSSDDAVRHTGLDVTVYASDGKRTKGHLARQGPAVLRWALYEAAVFARPRLFSRPRLLPAGQAAPGRATGAVVGGAQARPPLLPHPARARRPGLCAGALAVQVPPAARPRTDACATSSCNPAAASCCWTANQDRAVARTRGSPHRHHVAGVVSEHRDKPGRPHRDPPAPQLTNRRVPVM